MSLNDRTNERIPLSYHQPQTWPDSEHGPSGSNPAELYVDVDFDSSCDPPEWIHIGFTDAEHDSDQIKLTDEEATKLRDRLDLILKDRDERVLDDIVNALPASAEVDDVAGEALAIRFIELYADVDQHIADRVSSDDYNGEVILFRFDPNQNKLVPLATLGGPSDYALGDKVDTGEFQRQVDYNAALSRKENGLDPKPGDEQRLAAGDPGLFPA